MARLTPRRAPLGKTCAVAAALMLSSTNGASAHIKWFCAFNVAAAPRGLESVLTLDFWMLAATSILALASGFLVEAEIGRQLSQALDRITSALQSNADLLIRTVCAFFFVALWTMGGVILTPELKTTSEAISWLQLAIAAGLVSRRTLPGSGLGIVVLYAVAAWDYGAFHVADYPIFLGIAAYFVLTGLDREIWGARPIDIVRYTAAVTLMWASVEKWAYPEWTFPLFIEHPSMTIGYDPEFFMRAAGMIEFALAFSLMWTPLVRRAGAILLVTMFVSAAFEFGKIDVIGHAPIVVVLLAIIADHGAQKGDFPRLTLALPAAYCTALAAVVLTYYGAHAALFGTGIL